MNNSQLPAGCAESPPTDSENQMGAKKRLKRLFPAYHPGIICFLVVLAFVPLFVISGIRHSKDQRMGRHFLVAPSTFYATIQTTIKNLSTTLKRQHYALLRLEEKLLSLKNLTTTIKKELSGLKSYADKISVSCPYGWIYFAETSSCYKMMPKATFNDAKKACVSMDSSLVTIHSHIENKFINGIGADFKEYNSVWIGVHREIPWEEGFVNVDGTPLDFTAWRLFEPNNEYGVEDCVVISCASVITPGDDIAAKWNDVPCISVLPFVCKKKAFF